MDSNKEKRKEELLQLLQNIDRPQQETLSEQQILAQCQSKDKAASKKAFRQLIQRYQNPVYTYVHQMVGDEAASNITRDVFVQAYRNISHIRPDMSVKAWLLKITKKKILKVSRKQKGTRQTVEHPEEVLKTEGIECEEIRNLLSAYIDDELSESETHRVEDHLADCEPCRLEYEKLEEIAGLVYSFGVMEAPANLQRQILAELDKETLWEHYLNALRKLIDISPVTATQFAVAASIVLIFFGVFSYYQHTTIQNLERQLRVAIRGTDGPEITINTFVIFTGKIVSEEMPLEGGEYVSELIPEPDKAEIRFIAGDITVTGDKITEYIKSIQGKITADQGFTHNSLTIRKITAGLPKHSNLIVSLFFQQLEKKPPGAGEPPDKSKISIDIYIIDKL